MGRHVHFIGIGGSGLSAIATILRERGEIVSGSDRQESPVTHRLREVGMIVFIGHQAENVAGADLVIRSSAVFDENVEVKAARAAGIPVLKRVDFLEQLIGSQQPIAVAGTHGKTTTTAWIAWLLRRLGFDPSFVIGGVSLNLRGNAHDGQGEYFVIEADEYDRMFLGLRPWIAVVTNVEYDHPDFYPTPGDFQQAFEAFVDRIQIGGTLLACSDDPGAASLLERSRRAGRRTLRYSVRDSQADYYARNPYPNLRGGYSFDFYRKGILVAKGVEPKIAGMHNVTNALAALGVADVLGAPLEEAVRACEDFEGTGRRFEMRGEVNGVTVIDDYAHHPTEIRATLSAARARYPGRRIWAVWQPHTYSRTRILLGSFLNAFEDADKVVITEIFAAREQPPADGFSSREVAEALAALRRNVDQTVFFEPELSGAEDFLLQALEPGDVVLVLSAGDANRISDRLVDEFGAGKAAGQGPD
jgi:UDP-N-acetylmuramate--alanine ligase